MNFNGYRGGGKRLLTGMLNSSKFTLICFVLFNLAVILDKQKA